MKTILFYRGACVVLSAMLLLSHPSFSQAVWTFRNGFGQSGATNSLADVGRAVCTDASGNIYVTGKISDDLTGNTVSFGGAALVSAGDDDGFVAKFNSSGVHQWSLRFGGTSFVDIGLGIATDGISVFVVGEANGTMTVGTSGVTYPDVGTGIDGVIMRLDAGSGAVAWVTRFGGGNSDEAQSVCLDQSGSLYVSGIFRTRTANPTATFGAFTRTVQGNMTNYSSDLFVARLNVVNGNFDWVSTGGDAGGNDNINGSAVCYVPSLMEVVVTGSYRSLTTVPGSTTATYSTTSPASTVTLTNSNVTTNEDFCLLEVSAITGAFISGSGVGAGDGNEAGLGITYDPFTTDVFFAGNFSSALTTFPGNPSNLNASALHDNILFGRYNPNTNAYTWVKDVDNSSPANAADVARSISSDGLGGVYVTGNFRNTATFPGGSIVTASGSLSDIFLARINVANGNAVVLTQGVGTSTTADDIGYGVAYASNGNNAWITGQYATAITFAPLGALSSVNNKEDIVIAKLNNPPPAISAHPSNSTACLGLPITFSVTATGSGLSYQWQESADAGFTSPTTLTNSGIYSGATTATLSLSDNSTINGKYYRGIVSNIGGTLYSNGALATATAPAMPATHLVVTQTATSNNNLYYGASCGIISKVVPSGGTPVSGNITSETWIEGAVPTYGGQPFVQRHYQVTPTAGSTATVTFYFTQTDFDNFNAVASPDLPTGPADAAGKANMRISKFNGSSNNGTGLPGSYTNGASLVDPVDANIVWNATLSRWEVTVDVSGFSGFFVQTFTFVLPVNLLSFSAQPVNNDIQLKWQTADETNNDHFELQRSIDGRSFTLVTQVPGSNAADIRNYEWSDVNAIALNTSKVYYRLKIVSRTGVEEYSDIVVVYLKKAAAIITTVTPNPFSNLFNLGLHLPKTGTLTIKLTNMHGAVLHQESVQAPKGFSTHTVKGMEKIPAGIYLLSVEFDGQLDTYKLVK